MPALSDWNKMLAKLGRKKMPASSNQNAGLLGGKKWPENRHCRRSYRADYESAYSRNIVGYWKKKKIFFLPHQPRRIVSVLF